MPELDVTGGSEKGEGVSEKKTNDDMTVPFCVNPISFLIHITRWKDLIRGLLLSATTTISLGLILVCLQEVEITKTYDTCPVISIITCCIIVFSNYMLWRSGQVHKVYNKLRKDQEKLHEAGSLLDHVCKLTDDTEKLSNTTEYLNDTAKNLTKIQKQMKNSTNKMFHKVVNLKDQRKQIGEYVKQVTDFMEDLGTKDKDFKENLQDFYHQVDALGKYLEKLQTAKNQLYKENERLEVLKNELTDQLKDFGSVKEEMIRNDLWATNVFQLGSYLEQRYMQLVKLTAIYEQNYIMQVVHHCEFIDGKPGWNSRKVMELCERLPQKCPEGIKNEFLECFDQLEESINGVVNYKEMEKLVKEKIIPYTDPIIKIQHGGDEY